MPDARPVYYWDSCVFLAYVKNEQARSAHIHELLIDAKAKKIEIVTSVLSMIEVATGVAQSSGVRDAVAEAKIDALWQPPSPVDRIELYPLVAQRARDLIRRAVDLAWSLRAPDAIHLASAEAFGVEVLHTYDPGLVRWSPEVGIPIEEPKVENLFTQDLGEPTSSS